jgi:hypothetical protein
MRSENFMSEELAKVKLAPFLFGYMINITAFRNEANEREQINRYLTQHRLQLQNIEFHIGFFQSQSFGCESCQEC